jgi:hypothetical protein
MDQRRVAIVSVAAIHLLLLAALRSAMVEKPYVPPPRVDEAVMVVTFVDEVTPAPPPPDVAPSTANDAPAPPSIPRAPPATDRERLTARFVESDAPDVAQPPPPDSDDAIRLVNPDGSLRLSQEVIDAAEAKPAPGYIPKDTSSPEFMAHESPVEYRSTRFDKYWVPDKETLGQELARKYPIAALLLQGVHGDRCPPRSIDPECENEAQPAFQADPMPDEDILD